MRWIPCAALIFELKHMPTIGKVMELILSRLVALGEASFRSKISNAFGFHKNKKLKLADSCEFHPCGLSASRLRHAHVPSVAIVLMLIT